MSTDSLILIDANVILRYLLNDHSDHSLRAHKLFKKAAEGKCILLLSEVVVAECVWVLTSFYKQTPEDVDQLLSALVVADYVRCKNKDAILRALDDCHQLNVDFIDAYIAEFSIEEKINIVATFNKKHFSRFEEIELYDL